MSLCTPTRARERLRGKNLYQYFNKQSGGILLFRSYIYKLFRSPPLYLGFAGTFLICCSKLGLNHKMSSVVGEMSMLLNLDSFRKIIPIFGALPFAANFAEEWKNRVTLSCVSRCGTAKYAVSNVVVCFLSALFSVFLPMMLFAWLYSFAIPVIEPNYDTFANNIPFGFFIKNNMPFMYITAECFIFAECAAMWAVMGLMMSAIFPNKYIAVFTPLVAGYVVERITINFPLMFDLWHISVSLLGWKSLWGQITYSVLYLALLAAICGVIFGITVKRRVQNEIV